MPASAAEMSADASPFSFARYDFMEAQRIRLFIKPWCGWCHEAKDWLDARGISYELLDVTRDSRARAEMKELSGQTLTPTLDVDGEILADFGVEELEPFLKRFGY